MACDAVALTVAASGVQERCSSKWFSTEQFADASAGVDDKGGMSFFSFCIQARCWRRDPYGGTDVAIRVKNWSSQTAETLHGFAEVHGVPFSANHLQMGCKCFFGRDGCVCEAREYRLRKKLFQLGFR